MEETTGKNTTVRNALKMLSDGALALAAALEDAQPGSLPRGDDAVTLALALFGDLDAEPDAEPDPAAHHTEPAIQRWPRALSYSSGVELSAAAARKRAEAVARAERWGYNFRHWSSMVRRLRTDIGTSTARFGRILGVSESCVHNWETGTSFANNGNLEKLEHLAVGIAGWCRDDWRGTLNGEEVNQ